MGGTLHVPLQRRLGRGGSRARRSPRSRVGDFSRTSAVGGHAHKPTRSVRVRFPAHCGLIPPLRACGNYGTSESSLLRLRTCAMNSTSQSGHGSRRRRVERARRSRAASWRRAVPRYRDRVGQRRESRAAKCFDPGDHHGFASATSAASPCKSSVSSLPSVPSAQKQTSGSLLEHATMSSVRVW